MTAPTVNPAIPPKSGVVPGAVVHAHGAVYARIGQLFAEFCAEQQMVEAEAGISAPAVLPLSLGLEPGTRAL